MIPTKIVNSITSKRQLKQVHEYNTRRGPIVKHIQSTCSLFNNSADTVLMSFCLTVLY